MYRTDARKSRAKTTAFASMLALSVPCFGSSAQSQATAMPIKHVVIIVGENRRFDHLFATYQPQSKKEKVLNLLSEGIVNADGSPGPNFAQAHQFEIVSAPR